MQVMQRNMVVDRLRGVAILLVLGSHFFGLWAYVHGGDGMLKGVHRAFGHGYLGVDMFFAISGYLIATTSVARIGHDSVCIDAPAFYVRRATRILPPLLLTLCAGAIAIGTAAPGTSRDYLFDMPGTVFSTGFWIASVGFAFNWFRLASAGSGGGHGWFGLHWDVLWSLAVEEQFYLVFPFAIMVARSLERLRTMLWVVFNVSVATRMSLAASGADWLTSATNSVSCFDALSLGVLTALADPWSLRTSRTAAVVGCMSLLGFYCLGYAGWGLPAAGAAASTALIIQASKTPGAIPQVRLPLVGRMGVLSYGLYLLQALAFAALPKWVLQMDPFVGFALSLIPAVTMAWLSFALFERPIERVLRRPLLRMLAAPASVVRPMPATRTLGSGHGAALSPRRHRRGPGGSLRWVRATPDDGPIVAE